MSILVLSYQWFSEKEMIEIFVLSGFFEDICASFISSFYLWTWVLLVLLYYSLFLFCICYCVYIYTHTQICIFSIKKQNWAIDTKKILSSHQQTWLLESRVKEGVSWTHSYQNKNYNIFLRGRTILLFARKKPIIIFINNKLYNI